MVGRTLSHYRVLELLGKGGMGEVYRAQDEVLGRDVAIKVLPEAFTHDPERLARFEREAKVLAALNHPHIAAIYGLESAVPTLVGEGLRALPGDEPEVRFLVLELVEGDTLAERLLRGPIPVRDAVPLAIQIAQALEAAHGQGVVHRDLKPANIKMTPDGDAKVLDFGLAKPTEPIFEGELSESPTLTFAPTGAGVIMGTAAYMSPEQVRGQEVDKRSDNWAFGVVLWEMLTGKKLFEGGTVSDVLAHTLTREPDWESLQADLPEGVMRVLRRCLVQDPKERLHDIADARLELTEIQNQWTAGLIPPITGRARPGRRRKVLWTLATIFGVAAVCFFAFWLGRKGPIEGSGKEPLSGVPVVSKLRQLTFTPEIEATPHLSPDGKFVTFAAKDGRDWDIFLLRVSGTNALNLTADSEADDAFPAFSPDGESIAFSSGRQGGGLFVMGATGESVTRVAAVEGYYPSWSPDGSQISFSTTWTGGPGVVRPGTRVMVLDRNTAEVRELSQETVIQPQWSPNGHRVAVWGKTLTEDAQRWFVATVAASGGELVKVIDDPSASWQPVWSPDGRYLFFSSDRGGAMALWRIPIDEATGEAQGQPEALAISATAVESPSLSGDGSRLTFVSKDVSTSFERVRIDLGRRIVEGPPEVIRRGTVVTSQAAVSPDGEWLAFHQGFDIWVLKTDGSSRVQLTSDDSLDRTPRWSADGSRLVFHSNRSGKSELWSIEMDGSGLRQLTQTEGPEVWLPELSPDGKSAFGNNEYGTQLFDLTGDLPATESQWLPNPWENDRVFYATAWSPDSRQIAGCRVTFKPTFDTESLVVYSLDTGNIVAEFEDLGHPDEPYWTRDGHSVLYFNQVEGQLYTLNLETGLSERIEGVTEEISEHLVGDINLPAAEDWLYFTGYEYKSDIYVAELGLAADPDP